MLFQVLDHPAALPVGALTGKPEPQHRSADFVDYPFQAGGVGHLKGSVENAAGPLPTPGFLEPPGQAQGQFGLAYARVSGHQDNGVFLQVPSQEGQFDLATN